MQDMNGVMGDGTLPNLDIQPRVYLRKMGGDYVEIADISRFERTDDASANGKIEFVMAEGQSDAVKSILFNTTDKYIDVKMEFVFEAGMVMVMAFSGFIEDVTRNTLSIAVSTGITTDVQETPESLH